MKRSGGGSSQSGATVPGKLLASKEYDPASLATYTTTSATAVDVDATNLRLPDFVVPSTGKVLVVMSAYHGNANTATGSAWCLRDGSGDVPLSQAIMDSGCNINARITYRRIIKGLTPGATITGWKWAWLRWTGATTLSLYADQGTVAAVEVGPALMEVYAA